jgi:hypothetical protein
MLAIDPLHSLIALAPLAFYALAMAYCNLRRRPVLLTGARDAALLGVAVSGLVAAGPMELFMPEAAAMRFHSYIWALLAVFYLLCLALVVLVIRPRIVVYNIAAEQASSCPIAACNFTSKLRLGCGTRNWSPPARDKTTPAGANWNWNCPIRSATPAGHATHTAICCWPQASV